MTLGGAFVYILENQRPEKEVNAFDQFENWSHVYIIKKCRLYLVDRVIMELQCILVSLLSINRRININTK